MSYFGRIAGRLAGAQATSGLARPAIRSSSPLVEFDQRLSLASESGEPIFDSSRMPLETAPAEAGEVAAPSAFSELGLGPQPAAPAPLPSFLPSARALPRELDRAALPQEPIAATPSPAPRSATRPLEQVFEVESRRAAGSVPQPPQATTEPPVGPPTTEQRAPHAGAGTASRMDPLPREPVARWLERALEDAPRADREAPRSAESVESKVPARSARTHAREAPEAREHAAPARTVDANAALGEALAKIAAWMKRPTPEVAASSARGSDRPTRLEAPTSRQRSFVETRDQADAPRLVIGQIDVEVLAPKEAPRPPARRARATATAAPARPAYSSIARQNFGARQR